MSQKGKISPERKAELVQRYLSGEMSIAGAAKEVCVDETSIRRWIQRYQMEGIEGLQEAEKNRGYSAELKERAVKEYLNGAGSQREICKKYKIRSTKQLWAWIKVYNAHGDFNSRKGRADRDSPRMHRQWKELRRDGPEIPGKLPTGPDMDAAL